MQDDVCAAECENLQVVPEAPPPSVSNGPSVDTGQAIVPDVMQDVPNVLHTGSPPSCCCGECGEMIPNDVYQCHKEACYGGLLHYDGPCYPLPNVSIQSLKIVFGIVNQILWILLYYCYSNFSLFIPVVIIRTH